MTLIDDLGALRERALSDLDVVYNYYTDTKTAWRLVHRVVASGHKFATRNKATGSVTTQTELAAKARGYVAEQLAEATFQQFVSVFESYFFDFLRLWLTAHPRSLAKKQIEFGEILAAPDKDAITESVVSKELNQVLYERPAGWFDYLKEKVNLLAPTPHDVERIAEAKATRDVLIHNRGIASKSYELKSGIRARHKVGERLDVPEHYHRETWQLIRKTIIDISDGAIAKAS